MQMKQHVKLRNCVFSANKTTYYDTIGMSSISFLPYLRHFCIIFENLVHSFGPFIPKRFNLYILIKSKMTTANSSNIKP